MKTCRKKVLNRKYTGIGFHFLGIGLGQSKPSPIFVKRRKEVLREGGPGFFLPALSCLILLQRFYIYLCLFMCSNILLILSISVILLYGCEFVAVVDLPCFTFFSYLAEHHLYSAPYFQRLWWCIYDLPYDLNAIV